MKKIAAADSSAYTPLYIQVYNLLRQAIERGDYQPGDRLPSEFELVEKYSISRTTAIAAIEELEKSRLVYREQGRGTFVAKPVVNNFSFHMSFTDIIRERGMRPSSRLLALRPAAPDAVTVQKLRVPTEEEYYQLVRVRCANEEPVALQYAYLPAARFPGLLEQDFEHNNLFRIIQDAYHILPAWSEAVVEAMAAEKEEAQSLEIKEGAPVLMVWHLTLDDKYRPIEYVCSVYRSDRFSFATGRSPVVFNK